MERTQKTLKLSNVEKLTNGLNPTFKNWKLMIRDKLTINWDHFDGELAKMFYVYSRTAGDI
jgi:hypothetical protein